jgi:hypothetical protein
MHVMPATHFLIVLREPRGLWKALFVLAGLLSQTLVVCKSCLVLFCCMPPLPGAAV